ncbi:MAG: twin-arginine translocation signal domain-containing protein [Collinsella sp.]|nr:twin-arginine translocation signal domain-containing protein [Collinsella sp.]
MSHLNTAFSQSASALTRRQFIRAAAAAILAAGVPVSLSACGSSSSAKSVITVGSKDFTEGEILSEVYALALEDAGFTVKRSFDIASSVIPTALEKGEVDLYPEYTGTALLTILKDDLETDPKAVYQTVKKQYKKKWDLVWLDMSDAADSQGLVITTVAAEKYNIKTISDLQAHASELRFASQGEFDERSDGLPALEAAYGPFDWKEHAVYDNGLKYEVLKNDEADVTPAYTTEGQLVDDAFTLLEDDKHVWPPYNVAPVVRGEVLKANPDIEDVLNAVSKKLTTKTLTKLNAKVDIDKQDYEDVAEDYFDSL